MKQALHLLVDLDGNVIVELLDREVSNRFLREFPDRKLAAASDSTTAVAQLLLSGQPRRFFGGDDSKVERSYLH